MLTQRCRLILWILMAAVLSLGSVPGSTIAQTGSTSDEHIPRLWDPNEPVDILVHNPGREPLALPEPFTPASIPEVYGRGVTEDDLVRMTGMMDGRAPVRMRIGTNVTFLITYADEDGEGFYDAELGDARRQAFEHGVSRWAANLQGPAFISIQATMSPLGGTETAATLASCGPGGWHENFTHAPVANTNYAEAMVEIISGSDPNSGTFDINVDFNSDVDNTTVLAGTDWYYGLDALPGNDLDFATVTIHELCHGLGFHSSFRSDGKHGTGSTGHPTIFDRFLVDHAGIQLISKTASSTIVTNNNVYWNGRLGQYALTTNFHGTDRLPMYAPAEWKNGSSISHLDETAFTRDWDLMTPEYDDPRHTLDAIVLGIMQDIGHSLPESRYVNRAAVGFEDGSNANPFNTVLEAVTATPTGGIVRILPSAYPETMTISRAMELRSSGGTAIIGTWAQ